MYPRLSKIKFHGRINDAVPLLLAAQITKAQPVIKPDPVRRSVHRHPVKPHFFPHIMCQIRKQRAADSLPVISLVHKKQRDMLRIPERDHTHDPAVRNRHKHLIGTHDKHPVECTVRDKILEVLHTLGCIYICLKPQESLPRQPHGILPVVTICTSDLIRRFHLCLRLLYML